MTFELKNRIAELFAVEAGIKNHELGLPVSDVDRLYQRRDQLKLEIAANERDYVSRDYLHPAYVF